MEILDDIWNRIQTDKYIFFRGFMSENAAYENYELMKSAQIDCIIEKNIPINDPVIFGQQNAFSHIIKVGSKDLPKATNFMFEFLREQPPSYFENHVFNQLENEELKKYLDPNTDATKEDIITTLKILESRGLMMDEIESQKIINKVDQKILTGKKSNVYKLYTFFIASLISIAINWFLFFIFIMILADTAFAKKSINEKTKVYLYDIASRNLSKTCIGISMFFLVFYFIMLFVNKGRTTLYGFIVLPF